MGSIWNPFNWFGSSDDTTPEPTTGAGTETFMPTVEDIFYQYPQPLPVQNTSPVVIPEQPTNNSGTGFFGGLGNFLGVPNLGELVGGGINYKIQDELGLIPEPNPEPEIITIPPVPEAPEPPMSDFKFYGLLVGVAVVGGVVFSVIRGR